MNNHTSKVICTSLKIVFDSLKTEDRFFFPLKGLMTSSLTPFAAGLWEVLSCKYTLLLYRITWMVIKRINAASNLSVLTHFLGKISSILLFSLFFPLFSATMYWRFFLTCRTLHSTLETLQYEEVNSLIST